MSRFFAAAQSAAGDWTAARPSCRFRLATAPISWAVQDQPDAAWEQPFEQVLDQMLAAGFAGTELGPYGYFPTDPARLRPALEARHLALLSSFVPVPLAEPGAAAHVLAHVRRVSALLAAVGAHLIVIAGAQTPRRSKLAGRIPVDGRESLAVADWRRVGKLCAEVEAAAAEYGLSVVFHPHAGTFVETPAETERLFDALSATHIGLCLDTGHCVYGGGDPVEEAEKYGAVLRYVHVKDINPRALARARRRGLDFPGAVATGVFTPVGQGSIYFPSFFDALRQQNYSGWLVVEQDVKFGQEDVQANMAASHAYLAALIAAAPPAEDEESRWPAAASPRSAPNAAS
ncbi:MAG: TIM barrel protein [Terriglobales bacterium]